MTNTDEKRRTIRYAIEAPINCSYFNLPVSASARTVNFSQDGMHFISEMEFYPGSSVVIRAINDSSHQETREKMEVIRQTAIAEVRWCKKISENSAQYQVGVKYYEPWY
jgi:hypothetical protein